MTDTKIEMIPIDAITVVNPRVRNVKVHQAITENISVVGLKRPITVRRLGDADSGQYALVCGQGRLESFKMLGQETVPAIIVDVDKETGYVMSVVENIARRAPRASETLEQVGLLRQSGYSEAEIAQKIGYTTVWVTSVVQLLEKGERRLLAAAEAGYIPLHLAAEISRLNDADAQLLLLEAYDSGELKGKKISVVRRILEQRERSGKGRPADEFGVNRPNKKLSTEELAALYQEDTARHRQIQKKAERAQISITLAKQIFKELYANQEFCELLKAEKLTTVPKPLTNVAMHGGFL